MSIDRKYGNSTPKECVNRDKKGFATKQRMFGLLIIDEGPSLSMTAGRAVAHFKLVWSQGYISTASGALVVGGVRDIYIYSSI